MSTPVITATGAHSSHSGTSISHESFSLLAGPSTSESTFCSSNYYPSLVAAAVFGIVNVLCSFAIAAGNAIQLLIGFITFLLSLICYQWFDLHGMKMTRKEQVYFDEKNLLQTTERLDFNLPPVIEDLTPGGVSESRKPILLQLFRDEKDEEMQKWYKQHYGKVYENAMRAAKQERMMAQSEQDENEKLQKRDA
ncbi:hypothetical protein Tcan_09200 [Toxocara canis]|uniref:Transmembrane protein n=1 Tax=Toxocara canis TaxID=6265 RepID=A0A0B2VT97_TOXCA|nr:hypothetical protein Tcan_09200 [Toxocara canis]